MEKKRQVKGSKQKDWKIRQQTGRIIKGHTRWKIKLQKCQKVKQHKC